MLMKKHIFTLSLLLSVLLLSGCGTEAAPETLETVPVNIPDAVIEVPFEEVTDPVPEETTEEVTEETTEEPTEPEPAYFTLTFVGDCTLGSTPSSFGSSRSFVGTVGNDYDFPFAHVREYFENDDFTMANLEVVLADSGTAADKTFTFRGPTAYTQILTGSSVEAVTLANNHTLDFGTAGYASTKTALEEAGVAYVEANASTLYTTQSGLTIGIYAVNFTMDTQDMKQEVAALRQAGAQIVIAALHFGTEGSYRANSTQTTYAHACIDAGVDIVYGHHPHVLQRIEEYNGGIIYYSLGNFSFGGNTAPRDTDSAILQQEVIVWPDGTVSLGQLTIIPVSISSASGYNNYQPIPYEEGSEAYLRAMSKLDGTFSGPDLVVDYSNLHGDKEEETTAPTEGSTEDGSAGESSGEASGESSGAASGESSGGESGGSDAGSGSGSSDGGTASGDGE